MKNLMGKNNIILYIASAVVIAGLLFLYFMTKPESYSSLDEFDFALEYSYYGKCKINTYNDSVTKDLVDDGTATISFVLPERIQRKVYNLMREIDIISYPDSIDTGQTIEPSHEYKLIVTINDETRTISWLHGLPYNIDEFTVTRDQKDYLTLIGLITEYVHNTDEYKNMPPQNGNYQ